MVGLRADRRRIDQHVGSRQRIGAGELWEPLIPAGRQAELRGLSSATGQRTGGRGTSALIGIFQAHDREWIAFAACGALAEVLVLVVAGGDRDVQLAGALHERAVRRDEDRGVEAEPVAALGLLVQGRVHVGARLGGGPAREGDRLTVLERLGRDPERFGAVGRDRKVGGKRQLLQADDACAVLRGHHDALCQQLLEHRARPGANAAVRAPGAAAAARVVVSGPASPGR